MGWFAVGLTLPIAAAYAWVAFCDREARSGIATFFLRLCLAIGIGLGVSSGAYFLWLYFIGVPANGFRVCEMTLFTTAGLIAWIWNCRAKRPQLALTPDPSPETGEGRPLERALVIAFLATFVLAVFGVFATFEQMPLGEWDAWAIWNLRARTLFRAGDAWRAAFSPVYAHPDYPLLVPLSSVRLWSYLDQETLWTPWMIGCLLTFATIGVLTAGVSRLRSRSHGLLAGIVLLGMASFMQRGAMQYADIPLAFFILAAVMLLALYDASKQKNPGLLVLSGLIAGLAAWTKNEGLLFLIVLPAARAAAVRHRDGMKQVFKEILYWSAAMWPALAIVGIQKIFLAGSNDLVHDQCWETTLIQLVDPSRCWHVTQSLVLGVLRAARPFAVILPLCFLLLGAAKRQTRGVLGMSTALNVLLLMIAGYFLVYMATPRELSWHLQTSADRLILQLCPLGLMILFFKMATPEEAAAALTGRRRSATLVSSTFGACHDTRKPTDRVRRKTGQHGAARCRGLGPPTRGDRAGQTRRLGHHDRRRR